MKIDELKYKQAYVVTRGMVDYFKKGEIVILKKNSLKEYQLEDKGGKTAIHESHFQFLKKAEFEVYKK